MFHRRVYNIQVAPPVAAPPLTAAVSSFKSLRTELCNRSMGHRKQAVNLLHISPCAKWRLSFTHGKHYRGGTSPENTSHKETRGNRHFQSCKPVLWRWILVERHSTGIRTVQCDLGSCRPPSTCATITPRSLDSTTIVSIPFTASYSAY
jgi:hypothetical protein